MIWPYKTSGIPDHYFKRGQVPMTKSEVRCLALSKLRLEPHHHVLDIGCGTGSITVECGLMCTEGYVMAVDHDEEAIALTRANVEHFGLNSQRIHTKHDPILDILETLPEFDRIFIGGGGKALFDKMATINSKLKAGGILVANTILLESTYSLIESLKVSGFSNIECVLATIAVGNESEKMMMRGHNPVYIVSATKVEENEHV